MPNATLAQRLLACPDLPDGIVEVLAGQAGLDPIAESRSLPAAWTPQAAAAHVTDAPATKARTLVQLGMTDAQYAAIAESETRISVLRAMVGNRRINPAARTAALVTVCRIDPTLSNLDLSCARDADSIAEQVLADPAGLSPLARLCCNSIVYRALEADPTGTSLARWSMDAGRDARTVQGYLHYGFPSGNHLDLDDIVIEAVFTPGTDYHADAALARRDACRSLYHDAELGREQVIDLLVELDSPNAFTQWALGHTASRPRPGDIRAAVAASPSRSHQVSGILRDNHDQVVALDWYDDLLGAQSIADATHEYRVPRAAAAAMAARLGTDPVAWMAACEIAPQMLGATIDDLCDAALVLAR